MNEKQKYTVYLERPSTGSKLVVVIESSIPLDTAAVKYKALEPMGKHWKAIGVTIST